MSNMFMSYNTDTHSMPAPPPFLNEHKKGIKLLRNVKGEILGVQLDYAAPLQLYFHLENVCDIEIDEVFPGTTLFEILTTTHKVLLTHEFSTSEILNPFTGDLCISISAAEMRVLKKEAYAMKVTLQTAKNSYEIFTEKDGYLVIR